jgi:hypothetical protein
MIKAAAKSNNICECNGASQKQPHLSIPLGPLFYGDTSVAGQRLQSRSRVWLAGRPKDMHPDLPRKAVCEPEQWNIAGYAPVEAVVVPLVFTSELAGCCCS